MGKMYAITAQVETITADRKWRGSQQLPAFYLSADVQGIVSEEHAEEIARDLLLTPARANGTAEDALPVVHVTAVLVAGG